ncbi:cytochrome P450 monooxygenase-like protein [Paraphaeosphaeria sporulosa]|uniref:Cytochrome P450 monooxygenase-like protein n=1 Tax=Paraphaeosphaeria sporulosa TaxID=1460663 RepID=A0A177CFQ6_9PLEO|nr:cytochrome P450 monooxygenase-like protein [Paraphaeosphaeria sporulosa]OAG05802.1 cytochrome P450 monooxygenase-like protein [Paraphaeosphaeria sporulosa]
MEGVWVTLLPAALATSAAYVVFIVLYNVYFHPLAAFPGPPVARTTIYWKAYVECILKRSFCDVLRELHAQYGDVVRVGPNELHFADPKAYHDIYNNKNRWDKESRLYKSFNEDRSSFGFLTYAEAKNRKDVLNRSFSQTAIESAESLLVEQTKALCEAFERQTKAGKSSNLLYAFRCMSMDVITSFCFGKPIYAVDAPGFQAPIVMAMDASLPVFVGFKYSDVFKNMILKCPPKLSKVVSPATAGLVDLQQLLLRQINDLTSDPEKLKALPHNMTIYHRLLDADAYRDKKLPSAGSLYEESQALMFGGADTVGNTLMVGAYYLLQNPDKQQTLRDELRTVWPSLDSAEADPRVKDLERLPYLNAVIKESLRLSSGVIWGLLRVVPTTGAKIAGVDIPPGTIVSTGSTFVHYNAAIFPEPDKFQPERWLESTDLDQWLVAFSRGPRMCLGINLAWAELRLGFSHVYRKFELATKIGI